MSYSGILETEFRSVGLNLPAVQREKLATYCTELDRWNLKMNLTGLKDAEMVRRLVVEPVWIGAQLEMSGSLTDIGSGNGSPETVPGGASGGIPIEARRVFEASDGKARTDGSFRASRSV